MMFYKTSQDDEDMENRVEEIFSEEDNNPPMPPDMQPTVMPEPPAAPAPVQQPQQEKAEQEKDVEVTGEGPSNTDATSSVEDEKMQACLRLKAEGNALFSKGEVAEALAVYREAINLAPHKPYPHNPATNVSFPTEDDAAAAAGGDANAVKKETEEESKAGGVDYTCTAQLHGNAGLCLMKLDQPQDAIETLSEAIRHDPTYQKALLRRAECYFLLEKYPSAYADYEAYEKSGGVLDGVSRQRQAQAKAKQDEEMQKMLGDLKKLGNQCLGWFGLSTDNFKFDKDPNTGSYSMRFER